MMQHFSLPVYAIYMKNWPVVCLFIYFKMNTNLYCIVNFVVCLLYNLEVT